MKSIKHLQQLVTSKLFRILFGITIPLVLGLGIWYLSHHKSPFFCLFYHTTSLYCPGCGSGRAAFDLIHLNFFDALSHNILMVISLPFLLYYGLKVYIAFVFRKDVLPFFNVTYRQSFIIFLLIILFFVARNIPKEPFLYLAP